MTLRTIVPHLVLGATLISFACTGSFHLEGIGPLDAMNWK